MAVAALVLGILGLVGDWIPGIGWVSGVIFGLLAVIFGALGRKDPTKAGMATAGLVMGIITLALAVLTFFVCGGAAACAVCAGTASLY